MQFAVVIKDAEFVCVLQEMGDQFTFLFAVVSKLFSEERNIATNLGNYDEFSGVERGLVEVATQGQAIADIVDEFGDIQTLVGVVDGHGVLVELEVGVYIRA